LRGNSSGSFATLAAIRLVSSKEGWNKAGGYAFIGGDGPREAAMRFLLFVLGICIGIVATANSAEAQNYPWCAIYDKLGGTNCGFVTFEQCMETARGLGSLCQPNTQYVPPPGPRPLSRVYRRYPY
jgi:hypothetical protein